MIAEVRRDFSAADSLGFSGVEGVGDEVARGVRWEESGVRGRGFGVGAGGACEEGPGGRLGRGGAGRARTGGVVLILRVAGRAFAEGLATFPPGDR